MSDPVIRLSGLTRSFEQGGESIEVLRGVSLEVRPGEIVALLGPSGSGKSTLLQAVGLLEGGFGGSIQIAGIEVSGLNGDARTELRRSFVGFVYQFHHLLPDFTALENVIFPTAVREGRETPAARARGRELLARMGLADRIDFPSGNLSGGQKQRVAVARALMNRPELVLADEPTGNLDRASALQVMELIGQINRDEGTSFVISTHDEKIAAFCARQIEVADGLVTG